MNPTFSALDRASRCTGPAVLPHAPDDASEGAAAGTRMHAYLASGEDHADEWGHLKPPPAGRAEVAMALDLERMSAEELTLPSPRAYPHRGPAVVMGTVDALLVTDDALLVTDWKSRFDATPEPAATNRQIRAGLLAASLIHGQRRVMAVQLVRFAGDGTPQVDRRDLSAFDLELVADELRDVVQRHHDAARVGPAFAEGAWCRYCPAFAACGAKARRYGAALAKCNGAYALEAGIAEEIRRDPPRARAAYKEMQAMVTRVGNMIRQHAIDVGGWAMPDGTTYGPRATTKKMYDGRAVHGIVSELWGADVAAVAVEMMTSAAAIGRAARDAVAAGKIKTIKAGTEDVLTRARAAGAITEVVGTPRVEEY